MIIIITWPVEIFAASRNLRVSGRTTFLTSSINNKKGLSQLGAPLGRKVVTNSVVLFILLEIKFLTQHGRASLKVIRRCEVDDGAYGISPPQFITRIKPATINKILG